MNGLTLCDDLAAVFKFTEESASRFAERFPNEQLTGLEFFFTLENGFLQATYWTNADYVPFYYDTLKARFRDNLRMEHWERFYERWFGEPTQSLDLDGSVLETMPVTSSGMKSCEAGIDIIQAIGNMLIEILFTCRRRGVFQVERGMPRLNLLPRFGVQADDGFYWEEDEIV
jgi:hypothetical protein